MIRIDAVESEMMFNHKLNIFDRYWPLAPYLYVCYRINNRLKNKLLSVAVVADRPKELQLPILSIDPFQATKFFGDPASTMLHMVYKGDADSPVLEIDRVGCGLGGVCVPSVRSEEVPIMEQIKGSGKMVDDTLASAIDHYLKEYFEMVSAQVEPVAPARPFEVGQAVYHLKEADKARAMARVELVVTSSASLGAKDLRVRHIATYRETLDVVSTDYGDEEQWVKIHSAGLKHKPTPVLTKEEQDYLDYCQTVLAEKQ